jgi:hypothetical protein
MYIQIRQGLFETNSSSVHAIVVCRDKRPLKIAIESIPEALTLTCNSFTSWDHDVCDDYQTKADYLYTLMTLFADDCKQLDDWKFKVKSHLASWSIKCNFDADSELYASVPSLDQRFVLLFIEFIMKDEINLLDYLFNPQSFFEKGNDNWDGDFEHLKPFGSKEVTFNHEF